MRGAYFSASKCLNYCSDSRKINTASKLQLFTIIFYVLVLLIVCKLLTFIASTLYAVRFHPPTAPDNFDMHIESKRQEDVCLLEEGRNVCNQYKNEAISVALIFL